MRKDLTMKHRRRFSIEVTPQVVERSYWVALTHCPAMGGICADMVRDLMTEAIGARFDAVDQLPEKIQWLRDNGSAYVARETQNFASMIGLEVCTTPYYSPESNGMAESFVKTFKRDYVHMNPMPDAKTVLEKIPQWFQDYTPPQGVENEVARGV
jgi:transposase InsO family protein